MNIVNLLKAGKDLNTKIWNTHAKQIIEGSSVSLAILVKKGGSYLIERRPRRGFFSMNEPLDDFSLYMRNLVSELKNVQHQKSEEIHKAMKDVLDETIDSLIRRTRGLAEKYAAAQEENVSPLVQREQKLLDLGLAFFEAAGYNDVPFGEAYIEAGLPVNFQHPVSGKTALHETCAHAVHPDFGYMLLEAEDCDFLIRDKRGRLPYQDAYMFCRSVDLADKIRQKTLEQAAERNIEIDFSSFEIKIP